MILTESNSLINHLNLGKNSSDNMTSLSPVQRMFNGRSVFITGASGFIGRVLVEKLLFTYAGIERIYVLVRTKRKQEPHERINQILNVPLFDRIRALENGQQLLSKLIVIPGDIAEPNLGISKSNLEKLLQDRTLSIVFHSAATIKFDAPLKTAIKLNLTATKTIIELCRKLPNLYSLCHVSTAYVNSDILDQSLIEEKLYPVDMRPEDLIKLAELLNEDTLQILKPRLVGKWPNTYTFAKAMAEHYIADKASDLPVAIVRPSIVVAALKEPLCGWIDNINGPTGLMLASVKGLMRTLHVDRSIKADMIPVDMVVNVMIASSYYVAKSIGRIEATNDQFEEVTCGEVEQHKTKQQHIEDEDVETDHSELKAEQTVTKTDTIKNTIANGAMINSKKDRRNNNCSSRSSKSRKQYKPESEQKCPPIIHCTSGDLNPIDWGYVEDTAFPIMKRYPSSKVFRYPFGTFKGNKYHDMFVRLFVHYLPALILDLICTVMGKKRAFLNLYQKLDAATQALSHFILNNYNFKSRNINLIRDALSEEDREVLYMDITQVEWRSFWKNYVLGIRRYLMKEEDHTIPRARVLLNRAYYVEIALRIFISAALFFAGLAITRRL